LTVWLAVTEFTSSSRGLVQRGAPIVPGKPTKPPSRRGAWRYSLVSLDWVDNTVSARDDVAARAKRFFEHGWFAPFHGVWSDEDTATGH
jgi:hypothetical protein